MNRTRHPSKAGSVAAMTGLACCIGLASSGAEPGSALGTVKNSAHDLSQSFAGIRTDGDACAFCHTTHQAGGEGPLWNVVPTTRVYRTYQGGDALVPRGQPDGSSKLCLSCHDGLIAPTVRRLPMAQSVERSVQLAPTVDRSAGELATSHPVSTSYTASSAGQQWQLVPLQLVVAKGGPASRGLVDDRGRIQCTSCHDPHSNRFGNFLRVPTDGDQLCRACHDPRGYDASAHQLSSNLGRKIGCATCHASHGAVPGTKILKTAEPALCLSCHKEQQRPATAITGGHGAVYRAERRAVQKVTCSSCHDPHLVKSRVAWDRSFLTDPRDRMGRPRLMPAEDTPYSAALDPVSAYRGSSTYCLACHDGTWMGAANIAGELTQGSIRASEFSLGRNNLHIVHASARSGERASCTYCHDAHGSAGSSGVRRGAMLQPWIIVREFPYVRKQSCGSTDPLSRCH